jgi:hypothetical protein
MERIPGCNILGSVEADRSIDHLLSLLPDNPREDRPGWAWFGYLNRWIKRPDARYFALLRDIRIASGIASAVSVTGPSWSAARRGQQRLKNRANAAVSRLRRQLAAYKLANGIETIKWWTPRGGKRAGKLPVRRLAA